MKRAAAIHGRVRRQDGQVLPLVALAMLFVLIPCVAIVIDVGRVRVAQQQLQTAVDAAALAAGQNLPDAGAAYTAALNHSATGNNPLSGYGVTATSPTVTFECDSRVPGYTSGASPPCTADTNATDVSDSTLCQPSGAANPLPASAKSCNAVNVKETATVQATFAGQVVHSFTVTASSTASAQGGAGIPQDIVVILDATESMTDSCTAEPTEEDCAKAGAQALLQTLLPCFANETPCSATNAIDEVGIMAIPAMEDPTGVVDTTSGTTEAGEELSCSSTSLQQILGNMAFAYPAYEAPSATDFLSTVADYDPNGEALSTDYRPPSSTTLNRSSSVVNAVGLCPSGNTFPQDYTSPQGSGTTYKNISYYGFKDKGGARTYLAGAIDAASALLNANKRSGAANVIIILSDGGMSTGAKFVSGSRPDPCADAIAAGQQAEQNNDTIYTIGYGDDGNTCGPDATGTYHSSPGDKATAFLSALASPGEYLDAQTGGDLTNDFTKDGDELTSPRLLTDCSDPSTGC
jgi:hypothetical protein